MAVYALVFFSCILLSSATSLVDPNEVAENQFDELRELPIPVKYTRREVEQNCDYLGRDFKSELNTSDDKCRTLCKEDSRCSHYVWAKLGGLNKCFLKDIKVWEDSTPLADAECGFIISRIKWTNDELLELGKNKPTYKENCTYEGGQILSSQDDMTKEECGDACHSRIMCTHYVWKGREGLDTNMCYIKDIYSRVGSTYLADARCGYFEHRLEKD